MSIYTYVVDHGDDSPAIHAGMDINGGRCIGVTFDNLQQEADLMAEKLSYISNLLGDEYVSDASIEEIMGCKTMEELEAI